MRKAKTKNSFEFFRNCNEIENNNMLFKQRDK